MGFAQLMRRARKECRELLLRRPEIGRPVWKAYLRVFPPADRVIVAPLAQSEDRQEVFSKIFVENTAWGSYESRSGAGSTVAVTAGLRERLPKVCATLKVRTFLDAPCGDYNWMRHVKFPEGVTYLGADIVPALISDLTARYADSSHFFSVLDIVEGPLPEADLWLCRETLFHLPNDDILSVLRHFRRSRIRYLLTTNHNSCRTNLDVKPGAYRHINLRRPPFNLPRPIMQVDEAGLPGVPRVLALWSRAQIPDLAREG
jgi:hypothetical protein